MKIGTKYIQVHSRKTESIYKYIHATKNENTSKYK